MTTVITFKTQSSLTVCALQDAIALYVENFDDSPYLLIVEDTEYFTAKEILHYENGGADRIRLEVAGWLPQGIWMLTGDKRQGLFYSGTFA